MPSPTPPEKTEFSNDWIVLTHRERDLNALAAKGETKTEVMRAMWEALAADYLADNHKVAAERCQKKADKLI